MLNIIGHIKTEGMQNYSAWFWILGPYFPKKIQIQACILIGQYWVHTFCALTTLKFWYMHNQPQKLTLKVFFISSQFCWFSLFLLYPSFSLFLNFPLPSPDYTLWIDSSLFCIASKTLKMFSFLLFFVYTFLLLSLSGAILWTLASSIGKYALVCRPKFKGTMMKYVHCCRIFQVS